MQLDLEGRVAIVTGASRGLGEAAATALAAEGVMLYPPRMMRSFIRSTMYR